MDIPHERSHFHLGLKIEREVIRAFIALEFRSYGRIDGFYQKDGAILITDLNSSSGMAPSSFFFEQAACAGMFPGMIISKLIDNAVRIRREKKGLYNIYEFSRTKHSL